MGFKSMHVTTEWMDLHKSLSFGELTLLKALNRACKRFAHSRIKLREACFVSEQI